MRGDIDAAVDPGGSHRPAYDPGVGGWFGGWGGRRYRGRGAGARLHMETALAGRTHPVSQGVARTRNDGETVVPPLSAPGTVPASTFRQPAPIRRRTPSGTPTSMQRPFWLPEPVRLAPSS